MPNLAAVLNDEIRRLARKEVRAASDPLQDQIRELKKNMRLQRDTISHLQKQLSQLKAVSAKPSENMLKTLDSGDAGQVRLSSTSIKKHRRRLKLSQGELGQLLSVSTHTIVRWEAGTSKPRHTNRSGIARLRNMGIREVRKLLGE
jgi:DNA-binding transcriptional regulator YiaG